MAVALADKKSVFCIIFALLTILIFSVSPVNALKISSITFNVTNSTYGHYNIITLKVVGNQTGYDISIYKFNVSSFEGTSFLNRTTVANDTLTRINITRLIGAGSYYNLTLNISNSTKAGTALKYNLTSPCGTSTIRCFFKVSKATLTQALSSSPASSFTYDGKVPTITDTLTASSGVIVSGQSGLSFTLYNNSISTGSTGSSTLSSNSFAFSTLAGKYAAAGSYKYTAESNGNSNYTVTTSPSLSVTIAKGAHLLLSINGAVDSNASITYGTSSNFTAFFEQNQNYTFPANQSVVGNISVGQGPYGMAYDSENNLIYVANEFSNDVYVINPLTQAVVANISGIQRPYMPAYDSANNLIYVTLQSTNTTAVINPTTQTVIDNIKVGNAPEGIAYDSKNNLIYVANFGSGTVSVINSTAQSVISNISVGNRPRGIAYDSKNNIVYVGNDGSNTVSVINASNESVITTLSTPSPEPWAATYDSVNNLVYVGFYVDSIGIINPSSQSFSSTIGLYPGYSLDSLGYDSFNNLIYGTNNAESFVINPINQSAFHLQSSANDPYGVTYDSENNLIYISNINSKTVSVINPSYSIQIYVNSTLKHTSEYKPAQYTNVLSAGTYKVTAVSNANKTNVTYYETISKVTPNLTLTSSPGNFTQNGTDLVFHFSIISINNQLAGNFYINGSLKNSSITTAGTYNAGALPNIFVGTFNTSTSQNYTSNSLTLSRQVYRALLQLYLNGALDSNKNITQGTESNFTALISPATDYVGIYENGSLVASFVKGNVTYLKTLSPGEYKVVAASNITGVSNITYYERIIGNYGGSGILVFPKISNKISLGIGRFDASTNYLSISPSVYLGSSDFNKINISFTPIAANISFSLGMEVNPNSSQCDVNSVKDPVQGISLLPSISENGVISGANFVFSLKLDSEGMIPKYNISPYDVVLYKCDEQNSSWIELPTNTSVSQTGIATYSANSNSLSTYEIGAFTPAKPSVINTTISESGLPSGYTWNATYDGITKSIITPNNIIFSTAPGNYSFTAYNFTFSPPSSSNTGCAITYYPSNFKAGLPQSIAAGSYVSVMYSADGTTCSSAPVLPAAESYYIIYAVVIIAVIALAYALIKKLQRGKSRQNKNKRK